MFEFSFRVDPDILDAWAEAIEKSPQTTRVFIEGSVLGDVRKQVEQVNQYPGNVKYPIEWTSERQRRYYFAVIAEYDANGNIIPYERTGTFFDGVTVNLSSSTLTLDIVNPNPVAKYVIGDRQQQFHKNTGWQNPTNDYLDILLKAQDTIIDAWYDIISLKGLA